VKVIVLMSGRKLPISSRKTGSRASVWCTAGARDRPGRNQLRAGSAAPRGGAAESSPRGADGGRWWVRERLAGAQAPVLDSGNFYSWRDPTCWPSNERISRVSRRGRDLILLTSFRLMKFEVRSCKAGRRGRASEVLRITSNMSSCWLDRTMRDQSVTGPTLKWSKRA